MVINRNKLAYWLMYFVVSIVINIFASCLPGDVLSQIKYLGYLFTFELVVFIFINTKMHRGFLNFGNIFILILYVFHFGQVVINTFFINTYSHVRFLLLMNPEDALFGLVHIHRVFSAICIGLLAVTVKTEDNVISNKAIHMNEKYDFELAAKRIILFTFPVKLFIDVICVWMCLTVSGEAARHWLNSFPNVFLYWGKVSLVGFALLLVIYRNNPRKQQKLFISIELYILLMMISGIRSENVGYLCVFALLYFASSHKKMRFINAVLYFIAGILVLSFVAAAGQFRGAADKSINTFLRLFVEYLTEKNIILSLFDTCGDTGYTALCVINKWLPKYGPTYGDSYYLGWIAVIPNIPVILTFPGRITAASSFPLRMQAANTLYGSYLNIGGSLIGELFFNFGLFGAVLIAFLLGLYIGHISYKSRIYIEHNNHYGLLWTIPVMFAVTYWVRDYFGGAIREMVWGPLVGLLVISIFKNCKSTKSI